MSNLYRIKPRGGCVGGTGARGKDKQVTVVESGEAGRVGGSAAVLPSSDLHGRKKKISEHIESDLSSDFVKLSLSVGVGLVESPSATTQALVKFETLLDNVDQLVRPIDDTALEGLGDEVASKACIMTLFRGLGMAVWMRRRIGKLSGRVVDLKGKLTALRAKKQEVERLNGELRERLEAYTIEMDRVRSEVAGYADLKLELKAAKENADRLVSVAYDMEFKVRGEMARAFRDGQTDTWHVDKWIAAGDAYDMMIAEENAAAVARG